MTQSLCDLPADGMHKVDGKYPTLQLFHILKTVIRFERKPQPRFLGELPMYRPFTDRLQSRDCTFDSGSRHGRTQSTVLNSRCTVRSSLVYISHFA